MDFDVVVRGGLVVDGSGGAPFEADVAIAGGRIAAVGRVAGGARREIDARHMVVTLGFVDIHTHYDGQVTWENRVVPSSAHGVTTVVMPGRPFTPLAVNALDGATLASIAVAGSAFFIRTETHLYRIAEPARSSGRGELR